MGRLEQRLANTGRDVRNDIGRAEIEAPEQYSLVMAYTASILKMS